ncbi:P-II family nitrogen regulator [Thiohalophilus sp.]|uniref:P-II family nitrogen regulator n=1 Tax=Thiohalophilus sp. TaxID=3028392 RepID=UPI002ACE18A3|nr:P-II family nitrogen regulator [Thiohalophilus sp.]MDZ7662996.1 P-II family nitrogen regulator [Thiohalophilus sp.]MDZ7804143.1 P-II family nitrogen regulator [Thiohalophilus sp.]
MKEIKAYIRNNMVDAVIDALAAMPDIPGVAVVPVNGFGHVHDNGDTTVRVSMSKLEIDVPAYEVEAVIDCITRHARTGEGHPGDGKVYVQSLDEAVRIADGQRGEGILVRFV